MIAGAALGLALAAFLLALVALWLALVPHVGQPERRPTHPPDDDGG